MATIGIVQGGIETRGGTRVARRQYTGETFESRRAYAEETCDAWVVVSPKYDIVASETEIESYDLTRDDFGPFEELQWVKRLQQQLRDALFDAGENPQFARVIVLTDDYYLAALEPVYLHAENAGMTVEQPSEDTIEAGRKRPAKPP
ncbi:DUF6884 domain-containing protein [Haladaptatus sp. DJG-WS-42]|uniref:DUF6884 domain-containing protein n=1 Tax=Haladaptatus sp. DJG-WS-42 TaxID=3120516 RepID=UPI0030CCAA87